MSDWSDDGNMAEGLTLWGRPMTGANVAALERLFVEWSKTGGRVRSWEFLAAHGCLAVDALTEEQLQQLGTTREVLRRLATGEAA